MTGFRGTEDRGTAGSKARSQAVDSRGYKVTAFTQADGAKETGDCHK